MVPLLIETAILNARKEILDLHEVDGGYRLTWSAFAREDSPGRVMDCRNYPHIGQATAIFRRSVAYDREQCPD